MNDRLNLKQRRWLLKLLATTPLWSHPVAWALDTNDASGKAIHGGCLLMDQAQGEQLLSKASLSDLGGVEVVQSTGDRRFDQALGTMLADLAGRFRVRPGFGFYDDAQPNALALTESRFSHSQGSVLLGRQMLKIGMRGDYGDWFVMGICAHEFAHIVQYFSDGLYQRLSEGQASAKRVELHADFLSGYYMGLRAADLQFSAVELRALGQTWETLGDSAYTSARHHGTAAERLDAIEQGFKFARERPDFGINAACEVGARYLGV